MVPLEERGKKPGQAEGVCYDAGLMTASADTQGALQLKWSIRVGLCGFRISPPLCVHFHLLLDMGHTGRRPTLDKILWLPKGEAIPEATDNQHSHVPMWQDCLSDRHIVVCSRAMKV